MVDSDYYLAPVMDNYFLRSTIGQSRMSAFLSTTATQDFGDQGMSYSDLATINAEKIMNTSAAFAQPGGQTPGNLIHLKQGQIVGEWRDSTYGIGGGRIPYDVNTALVPAALRSIAALSAAGFFPQHPEWNTTATQYAQVWEDNTLQFFEVTVSAADAQQLVQNYTQEVGDGFPSNSGNITSPIVYHGLSLQGYNDQPLVKVMNTDGELPTTPSIIDYVDGPCRLFSPLLAQHHKSDPADIFRQPNCEQYPSTVPCWTQQSRGHACGQSSVWRRPRVCGELDGEHHYGIRMGLNVLTLLQQNNAYHGTVVWSWPMAMMAAGLRRQLGRCASNATAPDFCNDRVVRGNVLQAYNHLWDLIEANTDNLSTEVWSWLYQGGTFVVEQLGALPPPAGVNPTESDIVQLWSLTFLAVTRDTTLT